MDRLVRTATSRDVEFVAANIRAEDAEECRAASGLSPLVALTLGSLTAEVVSALIDPGTGNPVAILGVTREDDLTGRVWLLGTPAIERRSITFLRHSRAVTEELNERFPLLTNAVDARNVVHIRWLRWLGFSFIRHIPNHGVAGIPFIEFVRVSACATP